MPKFNSPQIILSLKLTSFNFWNLIKLPERESEPGRVGFSASKPTHYKAKSDWEMAAKQKN